MKNRQIKINTALNSCFQDSEVNFKFFDRLFITF